MMEANEAMKAMARRLEETPAHVLRGDGTLDLAAAKLTEAADELTALREALTKIARGKYDGLEVTHYSARECRDIARAALSAAIGEPEGALRNPDA